MMSGRRCTTNPPWLDAGESPKTVLVFLVESLWAPHHATGLEIARQHLRNGDDVHLVSCQRSLAACAVNPYHRRYACTMCRSASDEGTLSLGIPPSRVHQLRSRTRSASVPAFGTRVGDLRLATQGGHALGRAAASTLVSTLRESDPSLADYTPLVTSLLETADHAAGEGLRLLELVNPDVVYLFNGRYAESLPIVELCQRRGVDVWTHDLGYEPSTYRIVPNSTIHNLSYAKALVKSMWDAAPDEARATEGAQFFDGRRFGGTGDTASRYQWAKQQRGGALPSGFDDPSVMHRIGVFISSEDEMTTLEDYRNPVYRDQLEAFDAVVSHPWPTTTRLFVRSHPNLAGVDNTQTQLVRRAADHPQVSVIPSDSPIDSYALVEACDVALTFGSTVGIEAAYWGTPSVLVGRAAWEDLDVYRPGSHDEVIRNLSVPGLQEANPLPYGFMQRRWGLPFEHYAPWPLEPDAEGTRVLVSRRARVQSRIERLLDPSGGIVGRIAGLSHSGDVDLEPPPRTEHQS